MKIPRRSIIALNGRSPFTSPQEVNIFGELGCDTPNGGACTACCTLYEVKSLPKRQGVPCQFKVEGGGCAIHNKPDQPSSCRMYHCGQIVSLLDNPLITDPRAIESLAGIAMDLIEIAYEEHEIGQEEYLKALSDIDSKFNRIRHI